MKTFLKWLILIPLLLVFLAFCVMNRQWVDVTPDVPELRFQAPLFAVVFASVILGVLVGGFVTWVGQGKHRRAAREAKAEAVRLRGQVAANAPGLPVAGARRVA